LLKYPEPTRGLDNNNTLNMKTVILAVSLLLAANSWAGNGGDKSTEKQKVYISTSNNVKTYHNKLNCCGMFFTKDDITCTLENAEKDGMVPCPRCYGKKAHSKKLLSKN
jgi:hypothetical protein